MDNSHWPLVCVFEQVFVQLYCVCLPHIKMQISLCFKYFPSKKTHFIFSKLYKNISILLSENRTRYTRIMQANKIHRSHNQYLLGFYVNELKKHICFSFQLFALVHMVGIYGICALCKCTTTKHSAHWRLAVSGSQLKSI